MSYFQLLFFLFSLTSQMPGVFPATFTLINSCGQTIWPGVLANSGSAPLVTTGFSLDPGATRSLSAPAPWSGRFWARTHCSTDSSDKFSCTTGDCGSGQVECNGGGAAPPATLAEFTLATGSGSQDFYDVSLVDGYNLPMLVEPRGGAGGACESTSCAADLNAACPADLRVGDGVACKSACEAFGSPEYCCSGEYVTPNTCRPSVYSEFFKKACPSAYSYAYDDRTSTFTCVSADYVVTFCPQGSPSPTRVKSSGQHTGSGLRPLLDNTGGLWGVSGATPAASRSILLSAATLAVASFWSASLSLF